MMNPLETIFGQPSQPPPAKLKVYAPNGDTKEIVAYLSIRSHQQHNLPTELFLLYADGTTEVLSKKVVVKNLETGDICYDPRAVPDYPGNRAFITGSEKLWLDENPHWPKVLELQDNPVVNEGTESEGLNP